MTSTINSELSPVDGFDEFDAEAAVADPGVSDSAPIVAHQQLAERRARLENPDILRAARAL